MAVKTIAELKALWINGFIPDQDDYVDLFDTIEASAGGGSGSGNQVAEVTLDASTFNGSQQVITTLIPAQAGQIILIKHFVIEMIGITPPQQNYTNLTLGWELLASGYPLDLYQLNFPSNDTIIADGSTVGFNQEGNNLDEQPINAPFVIKSPNGIGLSGLAGEIHIRIEYEYYTARKGSVS